MSVASFAQALEQADEIEVSVAGRRSGRRITNPVWYVHAGEKLYLLPVHGSHTDWYKNLLANPTIDVTTGGVELHATARPITDPAEVREVVDRFRAKYGDVQIERYYDNLDVAVEVPLE
jgi:deazaflavin-dependent oxidoreductase (nitroreductase family)